MPVPVYFIGIFKFLFDLEYLVCKQVLKIIKQDTKRC